MLFRVNFNSALIISVLWHLLCFFMITIVVMPVGIRKNKLSGIYFLGSVLDKSSSRGRLRDLRPAGFLKQIESDDFFTADNKFQLTDPLKLYSEKEYFIKPYKESINKITEVEKALPAMEEENIGSEYTYSGVDSKAKDRVVLFKPPMPKYNEFMSMLRKDIATAYFKVSLKVLIASDGSVKAAETIKTSGYPEVNLIAIRYVEKWKFEPLSPDEPQDDQEAVILLEFEPDTS